MMNEEKLQKLRDAYQKQRYPGDLGDLVPGNASQETVPSLSFTRKKRIRRMLLLAGSLAAIVLVACGFYWRVGSRGIESIAETNPRNEEVEKPLTIPGGVASPADVTPKPMLRARLTFPRTPASRKNAGKVRPKRFHLARKSNASKTQPSLALLSFRSSEKNRQLALLSWESSASPKRISPKKIQRRPSIANPEKEVTANKTTENRSRSVRRSLWQSKFHPLKIRRSLPYVS